jgi:hypothetical protein
VLVQLAQVSLAKGDAVPVEELEDLDRDLAPIRKPIAQISGGEASCFRVVAQIESGRQYFKNGLAQKEMIVGDFIRPTDSSGEF